MLLLNVVAVGLVVAGLALLVLAVFIKPAAGNDRAQGAWGSFTVSAPTGLALVLVGVGLLVVQNLPFGKRPSAISTSTSSPPVVAAPATPSPTTTVAVVSLDFPTDNTAVPRLKGFTARGAAGNLGRHSIWLLDYDGGYTVDAEAGIANGQWTALDDDLGDAGTPLPFPLTVRVVLADPKCGDALAKINATTTDYTRTLPAGCTVVGEATVQVTKP